MSLYLFGRPTGRRRRRSGGGLAAESSVGKNR